MRRRYVVSLALLGLSTPLFAQQRTAQPLERLRELMAPGPEHAVLDGMAGTWDQEVRYRAAPGAEPVTFPSRKGALRMMEIVSTRRSG